MTREEAIHELGEWLEQMIQHSVPSNSAKRKALATAIALLSAEAVPQSEQYKKGFEDAKRAFLVEYAKESEKIRKRNAQLEVMLNAQKALSADAEQPKWSCTANFVAEQLDRLRKMTDEERWDFFIRFFSPSAEAEWIPCSERLPSEDGRYLVCMDWEYENMEVLRWADGWNCHRGYDGKISRESEIDGVDIIAWMPLPDPYTEMEP